MCYRGCQFENFHGDCRRGSNRCPDQVEEARQDLINEKMIEAGKLLDIVKPHPDVRICIEADLAKGLEVDCEQDAAMLLLEILEDYDLPTEAIKQ
jgi:hypothetical protein